MMDQLKFIFKFLQPLYQLKVFHHEKYVLEFAKQSDL